MCKGPAAGQKVMMHLRTEWGLVEQDEDLDVVEDNAACRMELGASKETKQLYKAFRARELSQEQQEATKWLLVKRTIKSNQDVNQKQRIL